MHTKLWLESLKRRDLHRREDNIKINLWEIGLQGVDWIHLAQDKGPVGGSFEHGNEHLGSIKGGEFLDYLIVLSVFQGGFCSMELRKLVI
jgi:hypothetical protein